MSIFYACVSKYCLIVCELFVILSLDLRLFKSKCCFFPNMVGCQLTLAERDGGVAP